MNLVLEEVHKDLFRQELALLIALLTVSSNEIEFVIMVRKTAADLVSLL